MTQVIKDYLEMRKTPESISDITNIIRNARGGAEVRKAMADGIEALDANTEVVDMILRAFDEVKTEVAGYRGDVKTLIQKVEDASKNNTDDITDVKKEFEKALDDFDNDWQVKIDHIILGIDEPTLERIIDAKLNERGV